MPCSQILQSECSVSKRYDLLDFETSEILKSTVHQELNDNHD